MLFEVINSSATSMCSIYKDNFTLQCLHAHSRWESTHIGWSRTCTIGFIFSYKIIVRVIYSDVFKGRQAKHLPRPSLQLNVIPPVIACPPNWGYWVQLIRLCVGGPDHRRSQGGPKGPW